MLFIDNSKWQRWGRKIDGYSVIAPDSEKVELYNAIVMRLCFDKSIPAERRDFYRWLVDYPGLSDEVAAARFKQPGSLRGAGAFAEATAKAAAEIYSENPHLKEETEEANEINKRYFDIANNPLELKEVVKTKLGRIPNDPYSLNFLGLLMSRAISLLADLGLRRSPQPPT